MDMLMLVSPSDEPGKCDVSVMLVTGGYSRGEVLPRMTVSESKAHELVKAVNGFPSTNCIAKPLDTKISEDDAIAMLDAMADE